MSKITNDTETTDYKKTISKMEKQKKMTNTTYHTTINKWGNSQGIRLTKETLKQLGLKENDELEVFAGEEAILLTKKTIAENTLAERLMNFYGKPLNEIGMIENSEKIDFGKPIGDEIW